MASLFSGDDLISFEEIPASSTNPDALPSEPHRTDEKPASTSFTMSSPAVSDFMTPEERAAGIHRREAHEAFLARDRLEEEAWYFHIWLAGKPKTPWRIAESKKRVYEWKKAPKGWKFYEALREALKEDVPAASWDACLPWCNKSVKQVLDERREAREEEERIEREGWDALYNM